ncbi:MAG: class I tRNA ligase family protein, partial [Verrucomicrobiota bacterium]|nr:class I tRNA ligase family protein [Verrucomicrobiota bacterium]
PADWDGAEAVGKSTDTLDVWIDSGSSSRSVLMQRRELGRPGAEAGTPDAWQADYYLEGSDQHRGWFQSSLLLSLAGNGVAPYRNVLTHGFMVDADREKISKSKQDGGYAKPQTAEAYVGNYGADIVRLWVASQDFRNDITVSEERIKKVAEAYRGIRNALRYQLSNLYDFDPAQHTVADSELTGLDRWILDAFAKLDTDVRAAFDACEFHAAYQRITQFVSVELSAVYHDTVKDRLYTSPANSPRRRSTQTALYRLIQSFTKMLSPMLVFTADEAWEAIPHLDSGSVHLADWEPFEFSISADEAANWQTLFAIRERALPVLEEARQAKRIGKGLEACVALTGTGLELEIGQAHQEDLRELVNVSQLTLSEGESEELQVAVANADGEKCERCWRWLPSVGSHDEHATLCTR